MSGSRIGRPIDVSISLVGYSAAAVNTSSRTPAARFRVFYNHHVTKTRAREVHFKSTRFDTTHEWESIFAMENWTKRKTRKIVENTSHRFPNYQVKSEMAENFAKNDLSLDGQQKFWREVFNSPLLEILRLDEPTASTFLLSIFFSAETARRQS